MAMQVQTAVRRWRTAVRLRRAVVCTSFHDPRLVRVDVDADHRTGDDGGQVSLDLLE
jgi:hypothetical protein